MGACASKPRGLENDMDMAPAPLKEESGTISEAKIDGETKKIVNEGEDKVVKVEEDCDLVDQEKRQSLGFLLKNEGGRKSNEDDKIQPETILSKSIKVVEEPTTESSTKKSNTNASDNEKIENITNESPVVVATFHETKKPLEVSPIIETEKLESLEQK